MKLFVSPCIQFNLGLFPTNLSTKTEYLFLGIWCIIEKMPFSMQSILETNKQKKMYVLCIAAKLHGNHQHVQPVEKLWRHTGFLGISSANHWLLWGQSRWNSSQCWARTLEWPWHGMNKTLGMYFKKIVVSGRKSL